jgi:hypothetical protein
MQRNTSIKPVNHKRARAKWARNFGPRARAIWAMPCTVAKYHDDDQAGPSWHMIGLLEQGHDPDKLACNSDKPHAAHVDGARGMGGCNTDDDRGLVPLCAHHHAQAGERGTSEREAFEDLYNISLEAEAENVAVELDAREIP